MGRLEVGPGVCALGARGARGVGFAGLVHRTRAYESMRGSVLICSSFQKVADKSAPEQTGRETSCKPVPLSMCGFRVLSRDHGMMFPCVPCQDLKTKRAQPIYVLFATWPQPGPFCGVQTAV